MLLRWAEKVGDDSEPESWLRRWWDKRRKLKGDKACKLEVHWTVKALTERVNPWSKSRLTRLCKPPQNVGEDWTLRNWVLKQSRDDEEYSRYENALFTKWLGMSTATTEENTEPLAMSEDNKIDWDQVSEGIEWERVKRGDHGTSLIECLSKSEDFSKIYIR